MMSPSLVRSAYSIAGRDLVDAEAKNQIAGSCVAAIKRMFFDCQALSTVCFGLPRSGPGAISGSR
jgi:hypothetical protein